MQCNVIALGATGTPYTFLRNDRDKNTMEYSLDSKKIGATFMEYGAAQHVWQEDTFNFESDGTPVPERCCFTAAFASRTCCTHVLTLHSRTYCIPRREVPASSERMLSARSAHKKKMVALKTSQFLLYAINTRFRRRVISQGVCNPISVAWNLVRGACFLNHTCDIPGRQ